jgi:hypothetical protein
MKRLESEATKLPPWPWRGPGGLKAASGISGYPPDARGRPGLCRAASRGLSQSLQMAVELAG